MLIQNRTLISVILSQVSLTFGFERSELTIINWRQSYLILFRYSSPEIILTESDSHRSWFSEQVSANDHADLYRQLWHECAGLTIKVPRLGDRVFYFPQGHIEQIKECLNDEDDTSIPNYHLPSKILCKVVDVELKAFPDSDEVFAEIGLLPDSEEGWGSISRSVPQKIPANSFRKVLTTSDASSHGGCCLPKAHVEKTFPPLGVQDPSEDQASQFLVAKDLVGATWYFQHIYRGNPKRHILANGWNKFACEKKLKAGDTCIFMRGLGPNEIFIGVHRAVRMQKRSTDLTGPAMRRGILVNAALAIDTRCPFTVIYHPRMCASAFVISYDKVMEALKVNYSPEMGFKMLVDGGGEDPEMKRFSGIITAKKDIDPARWPKSEWRCLKVQWDVTSSGQLLPLRVSPWDILPLGLDVSHMQLSSSVERKRSMPFKHMIRYNPFSRTNENSESGGLQSQGLTLSIVNPGSSPRQDETILAEDR